MLRVGLVAEGKSDRLMLEAMMRALHPDIGFDSIRPDMTLVSRSPHGWRGVKAWCLEQGSRLEAFMRGVKGKELDLLVIHADCSMAHNEGADRPCPPAGDTADSLRKIIVEKWLGLSTQPFFVLVTNPAMTTDAWVVSALEPPYSGLAGIECDKSVENELVKRHLLRKKDGEVKKPEERYRPLAIQAAQRLDVVCNHCAQAARFRDEFRVAVATLQSGAWV